MDMKSSKVLYLKIGIDPDVDKSGVATITPDFEELTTLTYFELFDYLKALQNAHNNNIKAYIECGFLNKSNWHKQTSKSSAFNAKIGENTGRNFETAKKICEMCEYLNIEHVKVRPSMRKLKSTEFKNLTKIKTRTNQEMRDAYMLVWGR